MAHDHADGGLAGAVGGERESRKLVFRIAATGARSESRGNKDDAGQGGLFQQGQEGLCGDNMASGVEIEAGLPRFSHRDALEETSLNEGAGVVDQHVQQTEVVGHFFRCGLDGGVICDVNADALDRGTLALELVDGLTTLGFVAIAHQHMVGGILGDLKPQALVGAGNEHNRFACSSHCVIVSV